jgi:hypothetical protein
MKANAEKMSDRALKLRNEIKKARVEISAGKKKIAI